MWCISPDEPRHFEAYRKEVAKVEGIPESKLPIRLFLEQSLAIEDIHKKQKIDVAKKKIDDKKGSKG